MMKSLVKAPARAGLPVLSVEEPSKPPHPADQGQASFLTHLLALLCLLNTFYTFFRKRHYRLFEAPIDRVPNTPSARRVKLDSSPVASSPLRYLSSLIGTESAESRAHPDPKRDVWELSVWDPLPVSLRLFCYFSPGHIILYWLFLPTHSSDPRPSTTVATAILLAVLISIQLSFLSSTYSQLVKDTSYVSKEVLHEYDTKFVRPRTQPLYRDVATQFSEQASYSTVKEEQYNKVVVFPPAFAIHKGFQTNPNPNYTPEKDSHSVAEASGSRYRVSTPSVNDTQRANDFASPSKALTAVRQPVFRPSQLSQGGSLGVYTHANSPLRRSASTNFTPSRNTPLEDNTRADRSMSPSKQLKVRNSTPGGGLPRTNADMTKYEQDMLRRRRQTGHY